MWSVYMHKWYDRKQNVTGKLLILVFHVRGIEDSILGPGSSYSGTNSQFYTFSFNELGENWDLFAVNWCRRNAVINITPKYEKKKWKFRIFSRSFINYSEVMRVLYSQMRHLTVSITCTLPFSYRIARGDIEA